MKLHHERYNICSQWIPVENPTFKEFIENIKKKIISNNRNSCYYCYYCSEKFSNIENLHKHLYTSTGCNLFAINEFFSYVKSLDKDNKIVIPDLLLYIN